MGLFSTVFETSASIVTLPTIALDFGAPLPIAQWVIVGNGLTIAALLVPMGRLSDLIGRKRIYVVGCCLFGLGALLASLATTIYTLIAARIIVGFGSAMTQGTAMAILVGNFDIGSRARILGLQMAGVGLGAMVGPAAGGLIAGTVGWRLLFASTAIAMLVVAGASQRVLRPRAKRPEPGPTFDYVGALLFSCLLVAGLLTLTLGPQYGWLRPGSLLGMTVFLGLALVFYQVERHSRHPMLDFALFRSPAFALGALGAIVAFMCIASMRFLAPFFFQAVKGFAPTQVGLLMLPAAAVTAVAAPFAGRWADRFGVRLFANIGFALALLGLAMFVSLESASPTWVVVVGLMILALGMSAFSAPNSTSILNSVESEAHGVAAGFVNLCRNTGNVIGVAFGTALVTLTMSQAGFPPSLSEVAPGASEGVFQAFAGGVQATSYALLLLAVPMLSVLVIWAWHEHRASR